MQQQEIYFPLATFWVFDMVYVGIYLPFSTQELFSEPRNLFRNSFALFMFLWEKYRSKKVYDAINTMHCDSKQIRYDLIQPNSELLYDRANSQR